MRELLLLRHAKSSWDDPALDDFDRPLDDRGRKAAPRMGRLLSDRGWRPDHAIVSPARRTRETWDLARPPLGTIATFYCDPIYEAPPEAILGAIRAAPPRTRCLLVIGHNPGLEMLAATIAGPGSDAAALQRLKRKFPTGAVARFAIETDWAELAEAGARLTDFVRPKDVEAKRRTS